MPAPAPTDLALVGAGLRGALSYGPVALRHPDEVRFVDVVEPNDTRRRRFAQAHGLADERCFCTVDEWLAAPRRAEAVVVATPDCDHVAPATAALEAGYDVLVEKPLAPTAAECVSLVETAARAGRRLEVCHVLRYTAFFERLHQVVGEDIGEVVSFEHRENVAAWHMAHSYVRGAYANSARAAPFLLAKCCHDLDLLTWNMGETAVRVSSSGSLRHFRPEHAPPGAPARCTDGCPVEAACPFSALHVYLGGTPFTWMPLTDHGAWDPRTAALTETDDERREALRTGPYGRCVYACDNDACDQQVVVLEYASGATGTLVVHGHAHDDQRTLRYDGTRATVRGRFGDFSGAELTLHPHRAASLVPDAVPVPVDAGPGLHGGGDVGVIRTFAASVRRGGPARTGADEALRSHLLGFAAEEARRTARVVDTATFVAGLRGEGTGR